MPGRRSSSKLERTVHPGWAKADGEADQEIGIAASNPVLALASVASDALSLAEYLIAYAPPKDAIRSHAEVKQMRRVLNVAARNVDQ